MNSKLLILSLLSAPLFAQDVVSPADASELQTPDATKTAELIEPTSAQTINPGQALMMALLTGAANASAAQDAQNSAEATRSEQINQELTSDVLTRTVETTEPVVSEANVEPNVISVEFKLVRQDATVDQETWNKFEKLLADCRQFAKDKQFEQAGTTFDQIVSIKPDGIGGTITVNATQKDRTAEQAGVVGPIEQVEGSCKEVMCEIYKTDVSEDTWKELTNLAYEVIKPQQTATYEVARRVAFSIIEKS